MVPTVPSTQMSKFDDDQERSAAITWFITVVAAIISVVFSVF